MRFEEWDPLYERILEDFGFSREGDRRSAEFLNDRIHPFDTQRLADLIQGEDVYIAGDAPCLTDELSEIDDGSGVVISADGACRRLLEAGVESDVVCTDLDGAPETAVQLSKGESIIAVHAHGDNIEALRGWVGEFDLRNTLGTTQTRPFGKLHNFGGFTDGDRCAFLADEFGASEIHLFGFDFDDPSVSEVKAKKLDWARRLLEYLGQKREEELL